MSFPRIAPVLAAIIAVQVLTLYLMGQPWICECGVVKLWEGVVFSVGNSQHIFDWYSFSHIIHGVLFYALFAYLFPRASWPQRLMLAVVVEVGWELIENTPAVIEHYRQQALAAGYVGDSILNSVSDTLMMVGGFLFARRFPVWVSVALCIVLELFVLFMIRDNLTLNVINLIYPVEWIGDWQSGS